MDEFKEKLQETIARFCKRYHLNFYYDAFFDGKRNIENEKVLSELLSRGSVNQNLNKVMFDLENITISTSDKGLKNFMGFHQTENGMCFMGLSAGNEYELPVYFILFYDGVGISTYIPAYGNTFNPEIMAAFGFAKECDQKFFKKNGVEDSDFWVRCDVDMMLDDITQTISLKTSNMEE